MRDDQPRRVKFGPDGARWSLGSVELRLARHGDLVVFDLQPSRIELSLVPLVEVVQVLDWLGSAGPAPSGFPF